MLAKIFSATLNGLDAEMIEIEVDVSNGMPCTTIVGLADTSIKESKERVKSCIKNSKFYYPRNRISVNLAPAHIYKYGTHFDLGIALGILKASGQLQADFSKKIFFGELSLGGGIRGTKGLLPMLICAKEKGFEEVFVPKENLSEACFVEGLKLLAFDNIFDLVNALLDDKLKPIPQQKVSSVNTYSVNFADIIGNNFAKRGVEIAAAGGHNVKLVGFPGVGKTMLAKSIVSVLPAPSHRDALEIMKIYSIAGLVNSPFCSIPFRDPHHSISLSSFIGGGTVLKPGEISLAHKGVLFLDEFPEFSRNIIESLRQPLENGLINIARANYNYNFPADFILVAAQNPCPCGFYGDIKNNCLCSMGKIYSYKRRISGPVNDRLDMNINVPRTDFFKKKDFKEEDSQTVLERVILARALQKKRYGCDKVNARATSVEIRKLFFIQDSAESLLAEASVKYNFSARGYYKILKLARTIADLSASNFVLEEHVAEALQYRFAE